MAETAEEFKEKLSKMKLKELKALAIEQNIETSKFKTKKDYISALLGNMEGTGEEERGVNEMNAQEKKEEDLTDEEIAQLNETLNYMKDEAVEFSEVEQNFLQIEAMLRTRKHKELLEQIHNAVSHGEKSLKRFQSIGLSLALLSSQKLIDTVKSIDIDAEDAEKLLFKARKQYLDEMYNDAAKTLWKIKDMTEDMKEKQRERLAEMIKACEDSIGNAESIGANVSEAMHMLGEAKASLKNDFLMSCIEAVRMAQQIVEMGGKDRKVVIKEAIDFVEKMINDAKGIGANVEDSLKQLEKAKTLFENEEFQICMHATIQAEQLTTEAIQRHVRKVLALQKSLEERYRAVATGVQYQQLTTSETQQEKEPESEKAEEAKHPCPSCGKPLEYIDRYRRWYCYSCEKYP